MTYGIHGDASAVFASVFIFFVAPQVSGAPGAADPIKNLHGPKSRKWRFGTHATPWHVGLWVPTLGRAAANAPQSQVQPPLGAKQPLGRHASCPKTAKNHQNASCGKKQPTPRPKWKRSVNISNQLQKLARNTCGHALTRFWCPGPMLQVTGLA